MRILFWNVDTQIDFMNSKGKLYVQDAEEIIPNLEKLTDLAENYGIKVVNTCDYHMQDDKEISDTPDFKTTFPAHCMAGTTGQGFMGATYPKGFDDNYYIVNYLDEAIYKYKINRSRNIILYKNHFDIFQGNKHIEEVLRHLKPDIVVVYGVATNVCVNFAVLGLLERNIKVIVVKDAIKELPNLPVEEIYNNWREKGAILTDTIYVENFVKEEMNKNG